MNWQLAIVSVIVAAAVLYLGRRSWRTWSRKAGGCGSGCGCSSKPPDLRNGSAALIPSEQITLRRRTPEQS
jgi:hypothetical protein